MRSLRSQGARELGQAHVVAIADVHVAVVELLVLEGDAELGEPPREETRPELEMELVSGPAVEVEQPERAQRLGARLHEPAGIERQPALPHLGTERAGLEIAR